MCVSVCVFICVCWWTSSWWINDILNNNFSWSKTRIMFIGTISRGERKLVS